MPRASPELDSPPASPLWRLLLAHTSCPLLGEVKAEAASLENKKPWLLPCPWHQIRRLRACSPLGEAASLSPSLHVKWTVLLLLVSSTQGKGERRQCLPRRWKKLEVGFEPSPLTLLFPHIAVSVSLGHHAQLGRAPTQGQCSTVSPRQDRGLGKGSRGHMRPGVGGWE